MRREPIDAKEAAEWTVRDIRRRTRKQHSAEEKIRIVLAGCVAKIPSSSTTTTTATTRASAI